MSNKSKSQQQPQPPQPQPQPQQRHSGVNRAIGERNVECEQVPPRYQPPPQPRVGLPTNQVRFCAGNGLPTAGLAPAGSAPDSSNHQRHSQALRAAAAAAAAKEARFGRYPANLENQPRTNGNAATTTTTVATETPTTTPVTTTTTTTATVATANPSSKSPGQSGCTSPKLTTGQYLPPNSQYPSTIPITVPRRRLTDDELLRLGPVEMLKFVRKTESDIARIATEQNRQIQCLVGESRSLKEANQRLIDDNQELRDLCCFLDDDRQKGRKLAREWQRFGRYTASVMRQEVSAYRNKLRQLDNKQQELIRDNLELKELCLYLDEERGGGQRDDGDGSSSSTNAEETAPSRFARHASVFNDQTMRYVRSLEQRVKQLEEDKNVPQARARTWETQQQQQQQQQPGDEAWDPSENQNDEANTSGRPEAVVRALQVLEVREQLEREAGRDGEKALVREMCNVVWRKLEEGPRTRR